MTPSAAAVKRWRAQHPTYMRDWMRRHRTNPTNGTLKPWGRYGSEYAPAERSLVLQDDLNCGICGIRRPDRLFVCGVTACPLKAEVGG